MKKILVILSSGKSKGNTAQLVDSFAKGAEEKGHSVEIISLVKNEVKPCLGCNACRYMRSLVFKKMPLMTWYQRLKRQTALSLPLLYISGQCRLGSRHSLSVFIVLPSRMKILRLADMRNIQSRIVHFL